MPPGTRTGLRPVMASAEQWFELWGHANRLGRTSLEGIVRFWSPGQPRERWLAEFDQSMDKYLRSSVFLGLMRLNLRTMVRSSRLVFPHLFR